MLPRSFHTRAMSTIFPNFCNSVLFPNYTIHFLNGETLQCTQPHLCSPWGYCIINVAYVIKTKENLQHKGDAWEWQGLWRLFWDIEGKLQWIPDQGKEDLQAQKQKWMILLHILVIFTVDFVCSPTLKKWWYDLTVQQGLDVVLCTHGKAA